MEIEPSHGWSQMGGVSSLRDIKLCSECLNEWNIYDKVVGITTDAGGNMKVGA